MSKLFSKSFHSTLLSYGISPLMLATLLFFSLNSKAQNEDNWWYFGDKVAIDFNSPNPIISTKGTMNQFEGSASISHPKTGQLLFYTDGISVWDKNHNRMPNGYGLLGHTSSSHSASIVPHPQDTQRYYIFTIPFPESVGFHVSEVDMSLNGGLGDIDTAFYPIRKPDYPNPFARKNRKLHEDVGDKVASTVKAGGSSYWVASVFTPTWELMLTTVGAGFVENSKAKILIDKPKGMVNFPHYGCMKFSPDGTMLAIALGVGRQVLLFDFDKGGGKFSNQRSITYPPQGSDFLPYGIEFSPNNKYLYVTSYGLIQFNLQLDSADLISASGVMLHPKSSDYENGQIQLAPNGKIYYTRINKNYLSAVEFPNKGGLSSQFTEVALRAIAGSSIRLGLPTFSSHLFEELGIKAKDGCVGDTVAISISQSTGIDSVKFNFGDPSSGLRNTSTLIKTYHIYNSAGKYGIQAIIFRHNSQGALLKDTLVDSILIGLPPQVIFGADTSMCWKDTLFPKITSTWEPICIWDDSSRYKYREVGRAGTFSLKATNKCGSDSSQVKVLKLYNEGLNLGSDTAICKGNSITWDISDTGSIYYWDNGSTSPVRSISAAGTYWARSSNFCGVYQDSVIVEVYDVPHLALGRDTAVCDTTGFVLSANTPGGSYVWSTGDSLDIIQPFITDTYWAQVSNICGVDSDTIRVQVDSKIWFSLGPDGTLCPFDTIKAVPIPSPPNYTWSTGLTDSFAIIGPPGTYWLYSSNSCNEFSDSVNISRYSPVYPVIKNASGFLHTTRGLAYYIWTFNGKVVVGEYASRFATTTPGDYQVTTVDINGCEESSPIYTLFEVGVPSLVEVENDHYRLFPNPVEDIINLRISGGHTKEFDLFIYNSNSSLVFEKQSIVKLNETELFEFSLAGLPTGYYLIKLASSDRSVYFNILKLE
ncbi:MAG: hypothetical protein KDC83_09290 [Flavobacteriales bacterium]|nr:hypothetical protein [Flavobacteriales bacterium]